MIFGMKMNERLKNEYYAKGYWSNLTIYDSFIGTVNKFPNRIAVVENEIKWSYSELEGKVQRAANGLYQLGVRKGDCVSVQLPNWVEYFVLFLATNRLGAIFNPIPITARHQEVTYMLTLCESKVYFVASKFRNFDYVNMVKQFRGKVNIDHVFIVEKDEKFSNSSSHEYMTFETLLDMDVQLLEYEQEILNSDDPTVILFTSGTESLPKGVIHSHNTILFCERSLIQTLSITEKDAILMPSPLSHATGFLRGMILPCLVGAKCVLMEHFSARDALKLIEKEKCTFTMGASVFLYDILRELSKMNKYDISSFRFFLCGGSPIPRHMVSEANEKGFKVLAVYGSTESSPHVVSRISDSEEKVTTTDGKPVDGIEVKIVDEEKNILPLGMIGEEASRGPNVFLGYLKQPEMTDKYLDDEGWYYSGDLCELHEDGYVQIIGRKKEMIIRGGQNISPREIEESLLKHQKVEKVAVVGIPDERLGEKTCAFVVPKKRNEFSFDEMISFLETQNIAKYKFPEKLEILDDLPSTASGKIQKNILRERYVMKR